MNPGDREGPAPFVSMTDGSHDTRRYKAFSVYIPDVKEPVVAKTDNRRVPHRYGASLQPKGVFANAFGAVQRGNANITLRGPDGDRYALRVRVAC